MKEKNKNKTKKEKKQYPIKNTWDQDLDDFEHA